MYIVMARLHALFLFTANRLLTDRRRTVGRDRGQATVEYAIVFVGAAVVAGLIFKWAADTKTFNTLFDKVMKSVTSSFG